MSSAPGAIRLRSHPNRWLVLTSLAVVLTAMVLPFTPLAPYLGFTPLPPLFFIVLAGLALAYWRWWKEASSGFTAGWNTREGPAGRSGRDAGIGAARNSERFPDHLQGDVFNAEALMQLAGCALKKSIVRVA